MGLHDEGQLTHAVEVRLNHRVGGDVDAHPLAPAQHDVQVAVGDGELVAHEEVVAIEHVVGDVLELLAELLDLGRLVLCGDWAEERTEVGVHLACNVVEGDLGQIAITGAIGSRDFARSLYWRQKTWDRVKYNFHGSTNSSVYTWSAIH